MDDIEIMRRVRAGEIDLLEELFERHHRQLFRYFLGRTSDRGASEDGVQETFHRVLRYRKTFRSEGSFAVWLYSIARNVHRNLCATRPPAMALDDVADLAGHSGDADLRDSRVSLTWALEELGDADREIVILSRLNELSTRDIGEMLGCTAGAAKVRIHRAVKRLRDIYLARTRRGENELSNSC